MQYFTDVSMEIFVTKTMEENDLGLFSKSSLPPNKIVNF